MSKHNNTFRGKARLDQEAEKYSDSVYGYFAHRKSRGFAPQFGEYFFPAMIAACTDKKQSVIECKSSGKPVLLEYKSTCLLNEMKNSFGSIYKIEDLRTLSLEPKFPIGQCAEQHAANALLGRKVAKGHISNIKTDIFFSKAIRPATGEVFPYCKNCSTLFDL